ncbi:DUF6481 family protein [Pelagibacterium flavum]|uniref:DUF6481 family protein n=1 Tax=Pelagibacterium flavum TaxID=2984530 RepID=A0ABY6IT63_9HYPH|nr:DUF6481 family protein [Pelagibacterium sp. YIM 151497]UYQ73813.1 DUF6481 family protein [Pelagibacterium sp. YIM 151497]
MNFKLPDHADRRKASADAKRALLEKIKAQKSGNSASDKKNAK